MVEANLSSLGENREPKRYRVGILGLGAIGAALAEYFSKQGVSVGVWNRTPGKAARLVGDNISEAASAQELVAESQLVISALTSYGNLMQILSERDSDAPLDLINFSTGTAFEAKTLAAGLSPGSRYLDCANLSAPLDFGNDRGFLAFAGSEALWQDNERLLAPLGWRSFYVSEDLKVTSQIDAGIIGVFQMPAMMAFAEAIEYFKQVNMPSEVFFDLIAYFARDAQGIYGDVLEEAQNGYVSKTASLEIYHSSSASFLEAIAEEGASARMLALATELYAAGVAAGRGASSVAAAAIENQNQNQ